MLIWLGTPRPIYHHVILRNRGDVSLPAPALSRSFYSRSPLLVAPDLLGKVLCRTRRGVITSGRIVEVEAYLGAADPASHAYRGMTPRNRAMFGPPGHAYVYFTYGNHFCVNVVTGDDGAASAVLIRALEPLEGIPVMRGRRGREAVEDLTSGPGKLCQALGIDQTLYGHDLSGRPFWIYDDGKAPPRHVRTPRIGISVAIDLPYRYLVPGSSCVSRARRK